MSEPLALVLTVALLLLNGLFVAAEFALVAARRTSIEPHAEAGSRRAAATLRAMEQVSLMMAGAQLGITVCSLGLGALSEPAIAHLLEPAFHAVGLPDVTRRAVAFAVALALVTVLHVVLGEIVPKNIALVGPDRAAMWLGPPLAGIVRALRPLIWLLNESVNVMLRAARVQPRDEVTSTFTRDEVAALISQSQREGLLDPSEHDLLSGALAFDAATLGDIALPATRVHTIDPEATIADVERLAARTGVTRFPMRAGTSLAGYILLKDTLGAPPSHQARDYLRPLPQLDAAVPLPDALELMRTTPIAHVVADGASRGIATLDDILARLVHA